MLNHITSWLSHFPAQQQAQAQESAPESDMSSKTTINGTLTKEIKNTTTGDVTVTAPALVSPVLSSPPPSAPPSPKNDEPGSENKSQPTTPRASESHRQSTISSGSSKSHHRKQSSRTHSSSGNERPPVNVSFGNPNVSPIIDDDDDGDDWFSKKNVKTLDVDSPEVKALERKVRLQNIYNLQPTAHRAILAVGRSRSGKSTMIGVLKDPCFKPKPMSIFASTLETRYENFTIEMKDSAKVREQFEELLTPEELKIGQKILGSKDSRFNFSCIDSTGLHEQRNDHIKSRSNEVLMKAITECLKQEITRINCVLITLTVNTGLSPHDIDAIKLLLNLFRGLEKTGSLALVCTHGEDYNATQEKALVAELRTHPQLKEAMEIIGDQVFVMGCAELRVGDNIESYKARLQTVYAQRMRLLNHIFSTDTQVALTSLHFMTQTTKEVINQLTRLTQLAISLIVAPDSGQLELDFQEYEKLQKDILENYVSILGLPDVAPHWVRSYNALVAIKQKQTPENERRVKRILGSVCII
jgi:hypothetical protein